MTAMNYEVINPFIHIQCNFISVVQSPSSRLVLTIFCVWNLHFDSLIRSFTFRQITMRSHWFNIKLRIFHFTFHELEHSLRLRQLLCQNAIVAIVSVIIYEMAEAIICELIKMRNESDPIRFALAEQSDAGTTAI